MTQEQKELLLKDICARLPYGVKCEVYNCIGVLDEVTTFYGVGITYSNGQDTTCRIDECKPYLFPISSMTEEQIVEFDKIAELDIEYSITQIKNDVLIWTSGLNRFNWLLKNHFDVYGLIEQDLAIDATNLNIY